MANITDLSGYKWRYILNALLVLLSILAVIASIIVTTVPNGAWLGLTDVQWHWMLAIAAGVTALNAAFNRTPQVQKPPTQAQISLENAVHEMRTSASQSPQQAPTIITSPYSPPTGAAPPHG